MKHLLLNFLVLLMLTPSLVCHMPLCADHPAQAESAAHPCADHDGTENKGGMLLKDCMGVDWQNTDALSTPTPDFSKTSLIVFTATQLDFAVSTIKTTANMCAPPPDVGDSPHVYKTALFLTTHRIRV